MCSWLALHLHLCSDDARDNLLQAVRHGELCSPLASHRALRLHASETGGRSDDHSPRLLVDGHGFETALLWRAEIEVWAVNEWSKLRGFECMTE
jgi:hypothetical protein